MELVNAGDGPATLVSLENSIPEGFDLVEPPRLYRIEKGRLDLKERRLDPLRVEELKLVLKPRSKGLFILQPRVIYLDETGRKKTHKAQPLYLLVSPVLEFLVKCFVEDSMAKRLPENSGWRTLMDIVNSLRIPKSQIYGDARKGHSYGKPLEALQRASMVEFRVFPGQRGRGGRIVRVRVRYDQDPARGIIEGQVLRPLRETKTF